MPDLPSNLYHACLDYDQNIEIYNDPHCKSRYNRLEAGRNVSKLQKNFENSDKNLAARNTNNQKNAAYHTGQREYHQNQSQSYGTDTNGICLLGEAFYSRSKNHYKSYSHAQKPAITYSHGTFAASVPFNQVRQPTSSFVTPRFPYHFNKGHEGRFDTSLLQLPSPTAKNYRHKLAIRESILQSGIKPTSGVHIAPLKSFQSFVAGELPSCAASDMQSAITSGGGIKQANLKRYRQHGYCLMCETSCSNISSHRLAYHKNYDHCYHYRCELSPDERILHCYFTDTSELKKCPSCERVFYKHRCYRHGCDFPISSTEMDAAPESNAGETDSQEVEKKFGRCLMCKFHFDDLIQHRKLWHLGNEKYQVRQVYGETVLLPEETLDKNLRKCSKCGKVAYRNEIRKMRCCAIQN